MARYEVYIYGFAMHRVSLQKIAFETLISVKAAVF
jgi:hypothetical protein